MNTYDITDEKVLKEIKRTNNSELTERMLGHWTEEEREGHSDMELLIAEVEWLDYLYDESNSSLAIDLKNARQILRKTKYGKMIKFGFTDNGIKFEFTQKDIQWAKDIVNEYNRFCSLVKRLDKYELEQRSNKQYEIL